MDRDLPEYAIRPSKVDKFDEGEVSLSLEDSKRTRGCKRGVGGYDSAMSIHGRTVSLSPTLKSRLLYLKMKFRTCLHTMNKN